MATKKTLTFDQWMAKVNAELNRRCGFSAEDLPDFCYMDYYNAGEEHTFTAKEAIEYAREGF